MFGKKKEDKDKLPDLPSLPSPGIGLRDFEHQDEDVEEHPLPAFPDTPRHNDFSQVAIKEAVSDEGREEEGIPEFPEGEREEGKPVKVIEMEEWSPEHIEEEHPLPIRPPADERVEVVGGLPEPVREISSQVPDVFVKIDKFKSAKKALTDVKEKLSDIDQLIHKIRDVKMREEQELSSWEKDMEKIKSRIRDVSENIFEKV